jgi:hypothetical protein
MFFGNDSNSGERDDLHGRPVGPISIPPEVVAQEKDIEAMFQDLIADSRNLPKVRERANVGWIGVVLLSLPSALGLWLLYLKSEGH